MKYPISIFLFISMFFVCSCAGLGGFPLYSGSYGSQAASRLTPVENPSTGLYGYVNDLGMWVIQPKFRITCNKTKSKLIIISIIIIINSVIFI